MSVPADISAYWKGLLTVGTAKVQYLFYNYSPSILITLHISMINYVEFVRKTDLS